MPPRSTGIVTRGPQPVRQLLQVRDPASEDEAVPALLKRGGHIRDDLAGARIAGDQVAVDHRHSAWHGRVGIARVAVRRGVQVQHRRRSAVRGAAGKHRHASGGLAGTRDGVPDLPDLHGDQVVELVAPVRRGGQPEPAARRDLLDRVLERGSRNVVAFIGDDQPVAGGQRGDVVLASEGLQGDDVDSPAELRAAAAKLPCLHAEELADATPPLVGQRLAVNQDQH